MMKCKPLHVLELDKYKLRVEPDDLGLTLVDETGKTVCWLNAIGTAVLKEWLNKDFDKDGRMRRHQSVQENLKRK